jgi:NAD(P)-dependent dehydrogenase (short-subunit alcohol dehydrogenase family)
MGAKITLASRNVKKLEKAAEQIKRVSNNQSIDYFTVDFSSFASIDSFVAEFTSKYDQANLINNAGAWFNTYAGLTEDNLDKFVQTNHLAPLRLTLKLLPIIKNTPAARVIFLSSDLHNQATLNLPQDLTINPSDYSVEKAYAKTKLMNVMVSNQLANKLSSKDTIVCSVHPGFVATNIGHSDLPNTWGGWISGLFLSLMHKLFARTVEQGAITSIYAATSDEIKTGEYYDSCAPGPINPVAKDQDLMDKLWTESLSLIGISEDNLYD